MVDGMSSPMRRRSYSLRKVCNAPLVCTILAISVYPSRLPPPFSLAAFGLVAAGRREVWETFAEGIRTDDQTLMDLGASGAAQLAFGDSKHPFIQRCKRMDV